MYQESALLGGLTKIGGPQKWTPQIVGFPYNKDPSKVPPNFGNHRVRPPKPYNPLNPEP